MNLLATPGFMPDPLRVVVVLSCMIWFSLFVAFIGYFGLSWFFQFWKSHSGFNSEGVYCENCRFDVRGATSESCPECGAGLMVNRSGTSRLGIVTKGLRPPQGFGFHLMLYGLLGFASGMAATILFGYLLPINYEPWLYVGLDRAGASHHSDIIVITVDAKRTWTNQYVFDRASSWQADYPAEQAFNAAEYRDEALVHAIWEDVVANKPLVLPVAERNELRDEFVAVFLAACDFDEQQARESVGLFTLDWEMYHRSDFHPLYVVLSFVVVIVVMIYAFKRAQRDAARSLESYQQKMNELQLRYKQMLARD